MDTNILAYTYTPTYDYLQHHILAAGGKDTRSITQETLQTFQFTLTGLLVSSLLLCILELFYYTLKGSALSYYSRGIHIIILICLWIPCLLYLTLHSECCTWGEGFVLANALPYSTKPLVSPLMTFTYTVNYQIGIMDYLCNYFNSLYQDQCPFNNTTTKKMKVSDTHLQKYLHLLLHISKKYIQVKSWIRLC